MMYIIGETGIVIWRDFAIAVISFKSLLLSLV